MSVNIDELKEIVKEQFSNISGSAHSYAHVERVFKIATYLAAEEEFIGYGIFTITKIF